MTFLCAVITAAPLFSTVMETPGTGRMVNGFSTPEGYTAVASVSPEWGGQEDLLIYSTDIHGMVTDTDAIPGSGEPLEALFHEGVLYVACLDRTGNKVTVLAWNGTTIWTTELEAVLMGGFTMELNQSAIYLAGNDDQRSDEARVVVLDTDGGVVSSSAIPGFSGEIADMTFVQDEMILLAGRSKPDWEYEIVLYNETTGIETVIQPTPGRYVPSACTASPDGGLVVMAQSVTQESDMIGELFLAKLTSSMATEWITANGGSSWEQGADIVHSADGYTAAGWTNSLVPSESNRSDLFMARFSLSGEMLWYRTYGSNSTDYGFGIQTAPDGGYVVSGFTAQGLYNPWLLKTDSEGYIEPQGIEHNENQGEILVTPLANPVCNGTIGFSISLPGESVQDVTAKLYDVTGRLVFTCDYQQRSGDFTSVIPDLRHGVYTIVVQSSAGSGTCRTVVTCNGGGR